MQKNSLNTVGLILISLRISGIRDPNVQTQIHPITFSPVKLDVFCCYMNVRHCINVIIENIGNNVVANIKLLANIVFL